MALTLGIRSSGFGEWRNLFVHGLLCLILSWGCRAKTLHAESIDGSQERATALGRSDWEQAQWLLGPVGLGLPRSAGPRGLQPVGLPVVAWKESRSSEEILSPARDPLRSKPHPGQRPGLMGDTTSPAPSASLLAIDDDGQVTVPDTSGAVGPNHLLVAVNSQVQVQARDGAVLASVTLDSFFSSLDRNIFCYDPRCLYDAFSRRWIISAAVNPGMSNAGIAVAVSVTDDPTLDWFRYFIPSDPTRLVAVDSPTLGLNYKWIALQANIFDATSGDFLESQVLALNKTNFYAGGSGDFARFKLPAGDYGGSQVPATTLSSTEESLHFVKNWNGRFVDSGTGSSFGFLRVFSLTGGIGQELFSPGAFVGTDQEAGSTFFTWADSVAGDPDLGNQNGTTNRIQLGDSRIQSVVFRGGSLWCAQTVLLPAADPTRSGVQWWELTPSGHLLQRYVIDDATGSWSYAYPSLAVNNHFDVLVGYNGFSSSVYASAYYAFYPNAGVLNEARSPFLMRAGTGPYVERFSVQNRWGDWSATCVDPLDDGSFWTLQEVATIPTNRDLGRWSLQWAKVVPSYDLQLTVSANASNAVPGQLLTWTLDLTNRIFSFAYGVRVSAPIPEGFDLKSTAATLGTVQVSKGRLYWDLAFLGQDSASCTITGLVTGDALQLKLSATARATGIEENLANNVSSTVVAMREGDPLVPPLISVSGSGGYLRVSWPVGFLGFSVERRAALTPGANWTLLDLPSQTDDRRRWVEVPFAEAEGYYRLRRIP